MINLLIQRTFNGLKTDYKSQELHLSNNDIENIFGDEQNAAQLSNSSVIYTLENQEEYRVYSYINTAVSDNAGRAGYYAIRLLIPKDKILVNLNAIFNKIAQHYEHYFEQQDLANQNYSELLAAVIKQNCLLDRSVITGSKKDGVFYLKYAIDERVDDTMNDEPTYLIKKLYLFAKEQSKSDQIIQQSGFKSFALLSSEIKQVKVTNPDNYLRELKINGKDLKLPEEDNFNVYLLASDKLTYADKKGKENPFTGTTLNILRPKPVSVATVYPQDLPDKPKGFGLGPLFGASLGALLIGGAIGWSLKTYVFPPKKEIVEQVEMATQFSEPYYLSLDPSIKDFILLSNNISDIASYKFKYNDKDKKWSYSDGSTTFKNLDSIALSEIGRKGSLNEEGFKEALEKFSGRSVNFSTRNTLSETDRIETRASNTDDGNLPGAPAGINTNSTTIGAASTQTRGPAADSKTVGKSPKEKTAPETAIEKKRNEEKAKAASANKNKAQQVSSEGNKLDKGNKVSIE